MPRTDTIRVEFTKVHDTYLAKYLAKYCPNKEGRSGRKVFERLVANEQGRWPWSVHHTWQSWRERYVKNSAHFDALILKYQAKHDAKSVEKRKRAADPIPIEAPGPSAKRVKLDVNEEEEGPSSEPRTERATVAQHASSSPKSTSKSVPQQPREPDVRPSSPQRPGTSTNVEPKKEPTLDLATHDTLEIPSLSPGQQAPPFTDGKPEPPHPAKQLKKRSRVSSPTQQAPSADVSTYTYPRVPPRVVDSFHGQVLVDRMGRVPLAFPQNGEEEQEEEAEEAEEAEEVEDKLQWPPLRGRTAEPRKASGLDLKVDTNHAFSQIQPHPQRPPGESASKDDRGQETPPKAPPRPDRRAIVAQFLSEVGDVRSNVVPQVESERHEDAVQNGASPVKRTVPPAPDPISRPVPSYKTLKFPAPRASTESPFRPESPEGEARPPRQQSRTMAARHPVLARIRRQTIENGKHDGRERELRQVPSVDLVALSHSSMSARSHSRSSTGASIPARPSRRSLPAYTHTTPWALDVPHGAPSAPGSVLGLGLGSRSGSGSPFRWVPSLAYGDDWSRRGRTRTSMPRFTFTPSPTRPVAAVATDGTGSHSHLDGLSISPSLSLAPHSSDLALTASHGLASILAHMSANHGLALGVVEAVYTRVGSLSEADEVLRGMREAAEGFGEREIEWRVRERRWRGGGSGGGSGDKDGARRVRRDGAGRGGREAALRYVIASEDGEGSEYSPPETSRAALWKRRSDSMSQSEDSEEGRAVEEELRDVGGENDDEPAVRHDFSQRVSTLEEVNGEVAGEDENRHDGTRGTHRPEEGTREERTEALVEHILAQGLERKMGKGQFRKDIVKRFV